jgi:rhodanese-related sulfurtransferase
MKTIARLAASALIAAALTGATRADTVGILYATLAEPDQKTQEVSTEELRRILHDGSAIVLDTRGRAEFDAGHIPGARNLDAPASELVAAVERLVDGDKAKALILYCNGPFCQASRRAGEQLAAAGFSNVRRYQLGIPVWRALGGPTAIELGGIARIAKADRTAVFIDARPAREFANGTLAGAKSAPLDELVSGALKKVPLPEDDFNRRIVLFGRDAEQARKLAEMMSKRPWHNVAYYPGAFEALAATLKE